ncbi:hypothetical protein [Moorena sp. SIO3H5]|nr:hypothetical protein [Moorena sp. SIO3H5]
MGEDRVMYLSINMKVWEGWRGWEVWGDREMGRWGDGEIFIKVN